MQRRETAEHLDTAGALAPPELARSLREVWQVNRYLGGMGVLQRHLGRLLGDTGRDNRQPGDPGRGNHRPGGRVSGAAQSGNRRRATLLDVGTGAADVPLALLGWARRRQLELTIVAVDREEAMVTLARHRTAGTGAIWVERADGRALPYAAASFDVALCNLALHHLDPDGAVRLLRELARVSRRGWLVADLERRLPAYLAAQALSVALWRSPITRHDGPLSVQRAYTRAEAERLVQAAGVRAQVCRHFPFRLALVGVPACLDPVGAPTDG